MPCFWLSWIRRQAWRVLVASLLVCVNSPVFARAPRVLLVGSGAAPELARKIEAESFHAGIRVEALLSAEGTKDHDLVAESGATGVVTLLSAERVRVYIAPSNEGMPYEAMLERVPADGGAFATRVIEQVRGSLIELRLLPAESDERAPGPANPLEGALPVTPPAPDPVSRRHGSSSNGSSSGQAPRIGVSVGAAGAIALGGVGMTPALVLGLRFEPARDWSVSAHALMPVSENEVREPEGEADLFVNLFLAEIGYRLARARDFGVELGPGIGLLVLPMEAEATPPRQAKTDRTTSGLFFAQAGLGWAMSPWLRLRGALRAGVVTPRPVVRFEGREVAAWGRGFVAATLTAELAWSLGGAP